MSNKTNDHWCWFLVISERGDVHQAFNSLFGATDWKEKYGGIIVKVKEVK